MQLVGDKTSPILSKSEKGIFFDRNGVNGIDLKNKGQFLTPWNDIEKFEVHNKHVLIFERVPVDEDREPIIKKLKIEKTDAALLWWRNVVKRVILWANQSGFVGKLKDGRPVYKMNIPHFDYSNVDMPDEDNQLESYDMANGDVNVRKSYGTYEEFARELAEAVNK